MNEIADIIENSQAILRYWPDTEFGYKNELEQVLSLSLPTQLDDRSEEDRFSEGALLDATWPDLFQVILIFVSATVATSILNKISEDIYNYFKNTIFAKIKRIRSKKIDKEIVGIKKRISLESTKLQRMREEKEIQFKNNKFKIIIKVGDKLEIIGIVNNADFEDFTKALTLLTTMSEEIKTIKTTKLEKRTVINYKFDLDKRQWIKLTNHT